MMAVGPSRRVVIWLFFAVTTLVFQLYFAFQFERSQQINLDFWSHAVPTTSSKIKHAYHNPIIVENGHTGTKDWTLINPAMNREVEGYMSHSSIHAGQSILLFHNTDAEYVRIEVFRTGWYSGLGARRYLGPITLAGVKQTIPRPDEYGMVACTWTDPAVIHTNSTWTTGVYLVRLTEKSNQTQAYTIFVVRNDTHESPDVIFQLPTNTYQAYNFWGGKSLYGWGSGDAFPWGTVAGDRARKVSYDRPYSRSNNAYAAFGNGAGEYLTNIQPIFPDYGLNTSASWNYNMVRWLEKNGIDISYITNVDTHDRLSKLKKPKLFLTQGHDEYWSNTMRDNVEGLRDNGTHLAFMGSNTAYFMVRMEHRDSYSNAEVKSVVNASVLAPDESRVIACFKRKNADPNKNELSVPARQYRPEGDMIGVEYVGDPYEVDLIVKNYDHWLFQDTQVSNGHVIPGLLGYEVDTIYDKLSESRNITILFETPVKNRGQKRRGDTLLCHSTIYTTESGVHVLGTGTMYWSWGLDDFGVSERLRASYLSNIIDKMTLNFFEAAGISH